MTGIAPGQSTKAGMISLDADTNADILEWEGDGDGVTADDDLMPIAHGARLTIKLLDAAEVTCCVILDPDVATTSMIGAQAAHGTAFNVSTYGTTAEGACFHLDGEGDKWSEIINWHALADEGHTSGVCEDATVNEDSRYYSLRTPCAVDADCNDVGGTPASTVCDTTPGDRLNFTTVLPSVFVACRSSAAADVSYWVTR